MKKDQAVELRLRKEMPFLSGKFTVLEAAMKLSLISPCSAGQIHVCWGLGGGGVVLLAWRACREGSTGPASSALTFVFTPPPVQLSCTALYSLAPVPVSLDDRQ